MNMLQEAEQQNKDLQANLKQCRLQVKAMKKVIAKYSDEINSFEVKTIPELKAFVNPEDAAVKKVAEKLKVEFQNKSGKEYAAQFLPVLSLAAFHFVSSLEVIGADLPVSFWFTPSDVLELGAADAFDRVIFLCSLLTNLGESAKVHVLEVESGIRHPVVITQNAEKIVLYDPFPPANYVSGETQAEALSKFSLAGKPYKKSLFEFNAVNYEEFGE
ncbi:MAG: hypothetical protein Q8R15_04025 [Candidatus Micrarchaeota archaeon]|nr:hypothetical protein [Candidatus Micrarchaeota archaeon]